MDTAQVTLAVTVVLGVAALVFVAAQLRQHWNTRSADKDAIDNAESQRAETIRLLRDIVDNTSDNDSGGLENEDGSINVAEAKRLLFSLNDGMVAGESSMAMQEAKSEALLAEAKALIAAQPTNAMRRGRVTSGRPFIVSYAGKVKSNIKLNIDYKPSEPLDAIEVTINFGEYERVKTLGRTYSFNRIPAGDRRGVLIARTMGIPDEIPVIITYCLEGDHTKYRHTTQTSAQLF